jgi:hypothetical protein
MGLPDDDILIVFVGCAMVSYVVVEMDEGRTEKLAFNQQTIRST